MSESGKIHIFDKSQGEVKTRLDMNSFILSYPFHEERFLIFCDVDVVQFYGS